VKGGRRWKKRRWKKRRRRNDAFNCKKER